MAPGKSTVDLIQGRHSVVWQDICAIHECRAGLQPVWCSAIKKRLCGLEEMLRRWIEHCEGF